MVSVQKIGKYVIPESSELSKALRIAKNNPKTHMINVSGKKGLGQTTEITRTTYINGLTHYKTITYDNYFGNMKSKLHDIEGYTIERLPDEDGQDVFNIGLACWPNYIISSFHADTFPEMSKKFREVLPAIKALAKVNEP